MSFTLPRFYPVLDTGVLARCEMSALDAAKAILEGGAQILQFRHKEFFTRALYDDAARIAEMCHNAGVPFVLNDRADFASLLGAALHLGQDDLSPADARKVVPAGTVIGFSTHNGAQLRAGDAEPVDYLAIGPIFSTGSKQNPDPVVGVTELRKLRSITRKPLVAIGGITRELAHSVYAAGADSLAVIGDLYPRPLTKAGLQRRTEEWLAITSSRK
jgi:thiamine-phosphate pyrophosphorylase